MVLKNPSVQIESTEAINKLYYYQFYEADAEFGGKCRYPKHPMPHFLMGLAEWWKIVPNTENRIVRQNFLAQMDSTITLAESFMITKKQN